MSIESLTSSVCNLIYINIHDIRVKINEILEKVKNFALAIFKVIKTTVTYPLRLLGAKTFSIPGLLFRLPIVAARHLKGWNDPLRSFRDDLLCDRGYHRFDYIDIDAEEAKKQILYACAAGAMQKSKHKWLEPFGYKPIKTSDYGVGLTTNDNYILFDKETGLKIAVYQNGDKILMAFGAFGSHFTEFSDDKAKERSDLHFNMGANSLLSIFGRIPDIFLKADKFVKALMKSEEFKNKHITLTGQSLGGSLASYVALKRQIPGVSLNAMPLGPGLQQKIGDENLQNADNVLTQVIADKDFMSDLPTIVGVLDIGVSALGFKTPGNFGKKYHVDSIYDGKIDNHFFILGSLFAKIYPEDKDLCKKMASPDYKISTSSSRAISQKISERLN